MAKRQIIIATLISFLLLTRAIFSAKRDDPEPFFREKESISLEELSKWKLAGVGSLEVDKEENALLLKEGAGSKGITLLSPGTFGKNVSVRFKIKPLLFEGVNVVFLSVSDKASGKPIEIPEDYDGNFEFWTEGNIQSYMAAFHTGFHQPNSWIRKNPGAETLGQAKDVATEQKWYDIEFSRKGPKLTLKVDGKVVCEGFDRVNEGLPGGQIGLRLRGRGDGTFGCLIKEMSVVGE